MRSERNMDMMYRMQDILDKLQHLKSNNKTATLEYLNLENLYKEYTMEITTCPEFNSHLTS